MNPIDQIRTLIPTLPGWCEPEKASELCDLVLKTNPKVVCEVGTFGGRSALAMAIPLASLSHGKLICIDPWNAQASAEGQTEESSQKWWAELDHEKLYRDFLFQLKRLHLEPFCDVIRAKSCDVTPPENIDILHLDGNHGEDAINDAQRYAPNVRLGGYCILDDLDWMGGYVRQAEDFIKSIGFVMVKPVGTGAIYQRMEMSQPKVAEKADEYPGSPIIRENNMRIEMAKKLTIAYITGRKNPNLEWFFDSLRNQDVPDAKVIVVDLYADVIGRMPGGLMAPNLKHVAPKPTIWQGPSRLTKEDWWAASNARNTAICLCETEWLACVDDRCVLMPGWADAIFDAMKGNYVVCGSYQKRIDMVVENGFIVNGGTVIGDDSRLKIHPQGLMDCPGSWCFGCCFAVRIDWALEINGFSEDYCDGLSGEDCYFGLMLKNTGKKLKFDPRARIIEDRTPSEIIDVMIRKDKGVSPRDKSHKCQDILTHQKTSLNSFDITKVRQDALAGKPWPAPTAKSVDWYDSQPLSEM